MGNAVLCAFPQSPTSPSADMVLKLVHSNGLVEEFYRPVMVGELSQDYPEHIFCNSTGLLSNLRICSREMRKHISLPSSPPSLQIPTSFSSSLPPSCSSHFSSSIGLADGFEMQLGQIYYLLSRDFPFSEPTAIADLLSKSSAANRKESYKDISKHISVTDYSKAYSEESLNADSITQDFVRQLLAETRLRVPSCTSSRFLTNSDSTVDYDHSNEKNEQSQPQPVSDQPSFSTDRCRRSEPYAWQPLLDTIMEDIVCN
ncbi:hypothetical protein KP509_16G032900 [Ceratopteris richardii]|uniref:Uncharacterized protein n=1 Tax=Ceratopteris richardii TaxID=49495 RepID=A0A8T2SZS2_CERRI|nr:hypothetical protein KP509_16G032900 [Ceratopteris richardii]